MHLKIVNNETCLFNLLNELMIVADQSDEISSFEISREWHSELIVTIRGFLRQRTVSYSFKNTYQPRESICVTLNDQELVKTDNLLCCISTVTKKIRNENKFILW